MLQNGDLRVQDFDKLWLLLFEEVDLGVLAQLQGIDEARVLHKPATVKRLNLQRRGQAPPLTLLRLPVSVHVSEDDPCIVAHLDLLGGQEQVLVARVRQQIFQVLHELAALQPATHVLLDEKSVLRALLEVELEEVARLVAAEQALDQDRGTIALKASLQTVDIDF